MLLWNIVIDGPTGTPYEGGKFRCELTFPKEFPNHAPKFEFTTQIFHPNFPNICPVRLPLPTSLLHLHFYRALCVLLVRSHYQHSGSDCSAAAAAGRAAAASVTASACALRARALLEL